MNLKDAAGADLETLSRALASFEPRARTRQVGRVVAVGDSIARIRGLPELALSELVAFPDGTMGLAFNLDPEEIGAILLGDNPEIFAGDRVQRTGEVVRVAVGEELLGRVIDPLGRVLDGGPALKCDRRDPVEREAPGIVEREPVRVPLATGIKAVDAMIPIGRGQRELIVGDRSTGKSTIAIDAILNQAGAGIICVYVAIGQRAASTARFIETLRERHALDHAVVVVADADSSPGLQYIAPYAGCTISEYFVEKGRDTLIVYDDLSKHARVYRQLSLLLRRPPGREAYPGDIFYLHSRLLERATNLARGGSQTALPVVETQAGNISAYIPTNLISITDGQIYLSPELFHRGTLPAVDVGRSVSRVGGKTQLAAMRAVAQKLRLAYAQFTELEEFTKFGTSIDEATQKALAKGRCIRELLKQAQHDPIPLAEQVILLHMAAGDDLADVDTDRIREFEERMRRGARAELGELLDRISGGEALTDEDRAAISGLASDVKRDLQKEDASQGEAQNDVSTA